jgi:hypothetical protein
MRLEVPFFASERRTAHGMRNEKYIRLKWLANVLRCCRAFRDYRAVLRNRELGVSDEPTDGTSQFARLVFRDECVAVCDLDQSSVWKDLGQPSPVLRGHDAVLLCPDHECWTVEGPQSLSRRKHVSLLGGAEILGKIAPDLSPCQHWTQPGVGHSRGDWSLRHPPKSQR